MLKHCKGRQVVKAYRAPGEYSVAFELRIGTETHYSDEINLTVLEGEAPEAREPEAAGQPSQEEPDTRGESGNGVTGQVAGSFLDGPLAAYAIYALAIGIVAFLVYVFRGGLSSLAMGNRNSNPWEPGLKRLRRDR